MQAKNYSLALFFGLTLGLAGCSENKTPDPFTPVLITNPGQFAEANSEAKTLGESVFTNYVEGEPLTPQQSSDLTKTIQLYEGMIQFKPTDSTINLGCGLAYHALGYDDKAISHLQNFVTDPNILGNPKIKPGVAEAYWVLSNCYFTKKNYEKSVEASSKAIETEPTISKYYTERASAELQLKQTKEAYQDASIALKLDPNDSHAQGMILILKSSQPVSKNGK